MPKSSVHTPAALWVEGRWPVSPAKTTPATAPQLCTACWALPGCLTPALSPNGSSPLFLGVNIRIVPLDFGDD